MLVIWNIDRFPLELNQNSMYFAEMLTKRSAITVVGFRRAHPKHSLQEQNRLMALHDVTKIYDDLDLCVRQRRPGHGDVVAVKNLILFADPKCLRIKGGLRQSMRDAISAIEETGSTILELDTGRRRDDPTVREVMMLDAIDLLARSRARSDQLGRPRRIWTPEQQTIMRLHWFDHARHHSNAAATKAINADGVRCSVSQVHKLLGSSKRMAGNPKLREIARAARVAAPKVVYFIQCRGPTGPVKIGLATNVNMRLSTLQVSTHETLTLLGTVPGDEQTERKYHARFREYWVSGEWFRCEGRLATFVAKMKTTNRKTKPK